LKNFLEFAKESKLYSPTIAGTRGTNIGTTVGDFSKTFPSNDKTVLLPFPKDKKRVKRKKKA
jgi:hypothetical protein